jgi:hypothetical protein
MQMVKGNFVDEAIIQKHYCNQEYNTARTQLIHTLVNANTDPLLRVHGTRVLREIDKLQCDPKSKVPSADLAKEFVATRELIQAPTPARIDQYTKRAETIQKRSWGKILGGVMLGLAGAVVVGLAIGLAVVSFGAAAPISIFGATIGASMILGGIAVGTGTAGFAASMGAGLWIGKELSKKPLRTEMEALSAVAKKTGHRN